MAWVYCSSEGGRYIHTQCTATIVFKTKKYLIVSQAPQNSPPPVSVYGELYLHFYKDVQISTVCTVNLIPRPL